MLRAMLGVGGVALITVGMFGGSLLENVRQSVAGVFEPEIVSEMAAQVEKDAAATETLIVNEAADDQADVIEQRAVAGSEPQETLEKTLVIETENLTEVKASARQNDSVRKTIATNVEPATVLPKEIVVDQMVKTTTGPGSNNTLYVIKDRVNMRVGPSINHPIVLQLQNGQELMEFKREGKWIHVGAYGTSGKIGWVHSALVGKN